MNRVLRFDNAATKANGAAADGVLGHPDFNFYPVTISDPLDKLGDITGDSTGRVFITTRDNGIHIFDNAAAKPNGAAADVTLDFRSLGSFYDPAADVLWVAEYYNSRVLRLGVPSNPPSAPVISTPAAGAVITNPRPVITGTGEISATITVTEGATSICTAVVAVDSTWTCTPSADLSLGAHTVSATQTDAALRVSPAATRSFTVNPATPTATATDIPTATPTDIPTATPTDIPTATPTDIPTATPTDIPTATPTNIPTATSTDIPTAIPTATPTDIPPSAPVIIAPVEGAVVSRPKLTGSGTAGMTLTVSEGTTTICTATVSASGTWSCAPSVALAEGAHTISATQTNAALTVSPAVTRSFRVDTVPPSKPVISGPATGVVVNSFRPTFSGTGEVAALARTRMGIRAITTATGTTVTVSEGTATICSATVAADGTWSCTATTDMANGAHTISITQTDAAGNISAGVTHSITVDALYRIFLPMINI